MTVDEIKRQAKYNRENPLHNGKVVLDEKCECGLRRTTHGGLDGHGSAPGCPQFTWMGFIYTDGTED